MWMFVRMARADHLTMWDVGCWNVVAGRQENTQRRRQWFSYKITAVYLFTTTGTRTPKPYIPKNRDLNPKSKETYTRVIPTPKTKKHTLNKTKAFKTGQVQLCTLDRFRLCTCLSFLQSVQSVSRTTMSAPFNSGSTRG